MEIKKLTKKTFALVMALVLTLTVIPVSSLIAAVNNVDLTLEASKTNVVADEEFTVSVNIPANTNLVGYNFALTFDKTKVEAESYSTDLSVGTSQVTIKNDEGRVGVAAAGSSELTTAGSILTVTFKALSGVSGDVTFGIAGDDFLVKDGTSQSETGCNVTNNTAVFINVTLDSISLSEDALTLNVGEDSQALTVTYNPSYNTASAADKAITWTSDDEGVATVSNGVVTGVGPGTTTITATSGNGKVDTCTVTVNAPITSIDLDQTTITLNEGETSSAINVTYNPSNTTDTKSVTWTSDDEEIATVDADGKVTGVRAGTTTVTATTANNKSKSCTVNVLAPLTGINLKSSTSLELNGFEDLTVTYNPTNTTDNKDVTWTTSDSSIVTVEKTGESTARITGVNVTQRGEPVTITATVGGFVKTCLVTVTVPVSTVSITEQNVQLKRKITGEDSTVLTAVVNPVGALQNADVEWVSSDEEVATVVKIDDTTARVTAIKDGNVTIKALIGGKEGTTNVNVTTPVQSISLNETSKTVTTYDEFALTVIYNPSDTTESLKGITWTSSDETKATVSNGVVTTLAPTTGTPVTITATSNSNNSAIATCQLTINPIPLTGVQIIEDSETLERGTNKTLTTICLPENTTDNKDLDWTTDDDTIATVDANGKVTAVGPGTTTITATSRTNPTLSDTCQITVTVALTGISISQSSVTLTRGVPGSDTVTLSATPIPADTTDTSAVTYTSLNPSVATVDANTGVVTAVGPGTTQIRVTKGSFSDLCTVTVNVPLESISLNKSTTSIYIKQSETLTVTYNPTDTNDDKTITWSSSDTSIATVDANGKVTAVGEGDATITATSNADGSITATCTVTGVRIPLNAITLSEATAEMLKGKTLELSVIYDPTNTTDDKDVTWTSSDESIATVDTNGKVTAIKEGDVTITATSTVDNNITASCDITVNEINIESVSFDIDSLDSSNLQVGKTFKLPLKLNPSDATDNYTVVWTSSDESIATIDADGNVTVLKEGNVKFTALVTTEYGETHTYTYEMYMKPEEVSSISPNTGDGNIPALLFGMIVSFGAVLFINKKRKSIKVK